MLTFSHAFFPKLLSGRHRHDSDACQQCDLLGPRCEEGQRFWKPMMEILALVRHPDASFFTLAMEVRAVHWTTFNTAANRYLQHLCAAVPSPHDASIPPALGPQRYCPGCREQTTWLFFWDYGSGTYTQTCGLCAFRQACERAALAWKLELGYTTQNAWIFRRLRQWITEDGCDAFHLEHQLEQWHMGFNPQTEPAWKHCCEAQGILAADMRDPYHPHQEGGQHASA